MTLKEQKQNRINTLQQIICCQDVIEYYNTHTWVETIEWMQSSYNNNGQFKVSDFQFILSLPQYKKSNEQIQRMRQSTNMEKYGAKSGRIISNYIPTYQDIYDRYVNKWMSDLQIAQELGVSVRRVSYYRKQYKIKRSKVGRITVSRETIDKRKQTCLEKYGVDNPMKNVDIKNKSIQTMIQRYGEDYGKYVSQLAFDSYKNKTGYDNPYQNVQNIKDSLLSKYGVDDVNKIPGVKDKANKTWHEHYDDEENLKALVDKRNNTNYLKNGSSNYRNVEQAQYTCLDKYGVPCVLLIDEYKYKHSRKDTKPNNDFAALLISNSIEFEQEFVLGRKIYDFKIGRYLLEINPTITHNSTFSIYGEGQELPMDYHYNKTKLALDNDFICLHIFDWTNVDKILDYIKSDRIVSLEFVGINTTYYNIRKRCVVEQLDDDCVIVYDDGYQIKTK